MSRINRGCYRKTVANDAVRSNGRSDKYNSDFLSDPHSSSLCYDYLLSQKKLYQSLLNHKDYLFDNLMRNSY